MDISYVGDYVVAIRESLLTNGTLEALFTCVLSHVAFQLWLCIEMETANLFEWENLIKYLPMCWNLCNLRRISQVWCLDVSKDAPSERCSFQTLRHKHYRQNHVDPCERLRCASWDESVGGKSFWESKSNPLTLFKSYLTFWLYFFSHLSHWKGFSPVCDRMWTMKLQFSLKPLPQNTHKYRFSTTRLWALKWDCK